MDIVKIKNVYIKSHASVVGGLEGEGPLGEFFDRIDDDGDMFGEDSWEKAESEMQREALGIAMKKADVKKDEIDLIVAGDLVNQCTPSSCAFKSLAIPFIGVFGACSTCAESIGVASVYSAYAEKCVAAVTSSHNCTAERQFRYPVEYAALRSPTSQWTVTASGAFLLSPEKTVLKISEVLFGRIEDYGIDDANNMGAAMAPAAADTVLRFVREKGLENGEIPTVVTGDLGAEGAQIFREILLSEGVRLNSHFDCGEMIFDIKKQKVDSGGSGCGCSASVLSAYFLPKIERGEIPEILFVATGALMNPMMLEQKMAIPGIAHLVHIEREEI